MNRLVIYTAAFGEGVKLMPQHAIKNADFICLTDKPRNIPGWQMKIVPKIYEDDNTRNNRYYKILPHLSFPDYNRSIYIDGNFIVVKLPADHFDSMMKDTPMLVFDHNQTIKDARNCIYEEYQAILELQKKGVVKDDAAIMQEQINWLRQQQYPANNGLLTGGVLIRDHHHANVITTMETWWQVVKNKSKRDQLSFNYAAWVTGLQFNYLHGDIRRGNPWFYFAGKKEKSLYYSLLKYKVRRLLKGG